MLDLLRTYRLLRAALAVVVMGSVAVPLAAPACAAAMHHQEVMEHEQTHEHEPVKRACCCGDQHSQNREPEALCPKDEAAVEQHHATTPCCTVGSASASDEVQHAAALTSAPQVPTLTLSRLAVALQPEVPSVPSHRSANDASDPPELGAVDRHVFIATFLI